MLWALCLALAGGCARTPPLPDTALAWERHRLVVAGLQSWQLRGRAGVRAGREGVNAAVQWEQEGPERYRLRLSGPFSQGGFELQASADGVELRTAGGEVLRAGDAAALVEQATGWRLPVSALRYWVRGLPVPDLPVQKLELDRAGRLAALEQAGWALRITGYGRFEGLDLPRALVLENPRLQLKLAVHAWRRGPV